MKGVLAKWYKTGNCAVEIVDLGRTEKNETLEWGRQMRSLFSAAAFLFLFFSICLSCSPFWESSTQENFDLPALLLSSRSCVVPSCFRRTSVLHLRVRAKRSREERRVSLSRTADLVSRRCTVFLPSHFFSTLLSLLVNNAIAFTILSLVFALGAFLPSSFIPSSLTSHLCLGYLSNSPDLPLLLFISFFLRDFLLSLAFSSFFHFVFFSLVLCSLSSSFSYICIPRARTGIRISLSFLPLQH